jgi:hypothetical protein
MQLNFLSANFMRNKVVIYKPGRKLYLGKINNDFYIVLEIINKKQKFYSLPKRYSKIRRFKLRPFVKNWCDLFARKSNLIVSFR